MKQIMVLDAATGIAPGSTAIFILNNLIGQNVEAINLTLGGTTFLKSHLTSIVLKANNKVVFETDGSKLDALEQFKNYVGDANHLSINFMENRGRTPNALNAGSYMLSNDANIVSFRLEVGISGSAVAPTLTGFAEVSEALVFPGEQQIARFMHRRHRTSQSISATNTKLLLQVPHLDTAQGGSIFKRIALFSQYLTSIQVVRGGVLLYDTPVADLQFMQKKALMAPQAGMSVIDFTLDHLLEGYVFDTTKRVCQSAAVYGTFSTAETIVIETEELLPLAPY